MCDSGSQLVMEGGGDRNVKRARTALPYAAAQPPPPEKHRKENNDGDKKKEEEGKSKSCTIL